MADQFGGRPCPVAPAADPCGRSGFSGAHCIAPAASPKSTCACPGGCANGTNVCRPPARRSAHNPSPPCSRHQSHAHRAAAQKSASPCAAASPAPSDRPRGSRRSPAALRPASASRPARPRVARRRREPAHLQHRLTARTEYPRRFRATVALNEHKTTNGGIDLHRKHPGPPSQKGASLTNGGISLRPRQHIADAPLAWFVIALHNPDCRYTCKPRPRPNCRSPVNGVAELLPRIISSDRSRPWENVFAAGNWLDAARCGSTGLIFHLRLGSSGSVN